MISPWSSAAAASFERLTASVGYQTRKLYQLKMGVL